MKYPHRHFLILLVAFFFIRLIGITNAPLETGHNWRQVTGNMVSRNFLEIDNNILYPRVDEGGSTTGIIGMEFPVLNYLVYMVAEIFGYQHWYGRLVNLIVSTIGTWFFYLFLASWLNKRIALYSSLVLLSSIWFAFSRKMMPDTFSMSLVFIAAYCGYYYLKHGGSKPLLLFGLFFILGVLSKIPALIALCLLVPLYFDPRISRRRKSTVAGIVALGFIPVFWWYFTWNPHLSETFGSWYNSGVSIKVGLQEIAENYPDALKRFYFSALHSYIALTAALGGLILLIRNMERKILLLVAVYIAVFGLYILKSGHYFTHHNYYIIPFVPVFAVMAGYAFAILEKYKQTVAFVLAGLVAVESILNQYHDFFIRDESKYLLTAESAVDQVVPPSAKLIVNGGDNPQLLYFTHRRGWTLFTEQLDSVKLSQLSHEGAQFLLIDRKQGDPVFSFTSLYSDPHFNIYKLP